MSSTRVRHTNDQIASRDHMLLIAEQRAFAMWAAAGGRPGDRRRMWLPTWYAMSVEKSSGRIPPAGECHAFAHGVTDGLKRQFLATDRPTTRELAWRTGESIRLSRVANWFGPRGAMPLSVLCMLSLWYQVPVRELLSTYGAPAVRRWCEEHADEAGRVAPRPVVEFPDDAPDSLVAEAGRLTPLSERS